MPILNNTISWKIDGRRNWRISSCWRILEFIWWDYISFNWTSNKIFRTNSFRWKSNLLLHEISYLYWKSYSLKDTFLDYHYPLSIVKLFTLLRNDQTKSLLRILKLGYINIIYKSYWCIWLAQFICWLNSNVIFCGWFGRQYYN